MVSSISRIELVCTGTVQILEHNSARVFRATVQREAKVGSQEGMRSACLRAA